MDRPPLRSASRVRWLVAAGVAAVPAVLVLGFGHRGAHAARSMLVPGAGMVEANRWIAGLLLLSAAAATVAWLRWGADWLLVAVVVVAMGASAAWGTTDHVPDPDAVASAAHEFPLVILVAGAVGWARAVLGSVPGFGWVRGRAARDGETRTLDDLDPADRARAVAVLALAGGAGDEARSAMARPDVARRCRRVGLVARARIGGDPYRVDHAHVRAALALTGQLDDPARRRLVDDATSARAGVPCSEPGWVRPLDATLAAVALADDEPDIGVRWAAMLDGPLSVRRGHRPAWWWTPVGVAAGRCRDWEHAAATALAHAHGWIDDRDWPVLRRRVLGAAARGSRRRDDERLIAAGRVWLARVDDPEAARIVARPSVVHDPLAVALDQYASHLAAVRSPVAVGGA